MWRETHGSPSCDYWFGSLCSFGMSLVLNDSADPIASHLPWLPWPEQGPTGLSVVWWELQTKCPVGSFVSSSLLICRKKRGWKSSKGQDGGGGWVGRKGYLNRNYDQWLENQDSEDECSPGKDEQKRLIWKPSEHNLCLHHANYFEIKSIQLNKYFFWVLRLC